MDCAQPLAFVECGTRTGTNGEGNPRSLVIRAIVSVRSTSDQAIGFY